MNIIVEDVFEMGKQPGLVSEENKAIGAISVYSKPMAKEASKVTIYNECGSGQFSFIFSKPGYATIFFDALSRMVAKAEAQMKRIKEVNE